MLKKREEYEAKIPALGDLIDMVKTEVRKKNPYVSCGVCSNGWKILEHDGGSGAVRCECWLEWKKRGAA
jgi:hypothetical protein